MACDLADAAQRDRMVTDLRSKEQVIVLPCGERSIRFRPALSVSEDEIDEAVAAVGRSWPVGWKGARFACERRVTCIPSTRTSAHSRHAPSLSKAPA